MVRNTKGFQHHTLTSNREWVVYLAVIASGISAVASVFIKECNASQLLQVKTKSICDETGNRNLEANLEKSHSEHSIRDFLQSNLYRPLTFLFTEPLVGLCAILCATACGLIYGLTESLTIVYTTAPFDKTFNETSSSLSFLAILLDELLNLLPRTYDNHLLQCQRKLNKRIDSETKIRSFALACPILAIGL